MRSMFTLQAACLAAMLAWPGAVCAKEAEPSVETIVFVRHGEKPPAGLGQLDCQGLNRSLALPFVLEGMFGRPSAIFAPDPAVKKDDGGTMYDYVRPLATIEPTAVSLGMGVQADVGVGDIAGLEHALSEPSLHGARVFVAWEHHYIVDIVRAMLQHHRAADRLLDLVPEWKSDDFDGIYVLRIDWATPSSGGTFERQTEGLNGQPRECPGPSMH